MKYYCGRNEFQWSSKRKAYINTVYNTSLAVGNKAANGLVSSKVNKGDMRGDHPE